MGVSKVQTTPDSAVGSFFRVLGDGGPYYPNGAWIAHLLVASLHFTPICPPLCFSRPSAPEKSKLCLREGR